MSSGGTQIVNVFPIAGGAFGFSPHWFEDYLPKMMHPAYLVMILLLVISIGIMALKRFENQSLDKKLWNLPVVLTVLSMWPILVLGLKKLIDSFNTFLVYDVFKMTWNGFGFPELTSMGNIFGWTGKAIATLLPITAYWLVYSFYLIFFFFYAVLGPFVLAKGILYDEVEAFFDLMKELVLLFLWQTTLIILVGFILPEIVSGNPLTISVSPKVYFLSLILGIMILFVPSVTRKFGSHLASTFLPPGLGEASALLGVSTVLKGLSMAKLPISVEKGRGLAHYAVTGLEFNKKFKHERERLSAEKSDEHLKKRLKAHYHKDLEEKKRAKEVAQDLKSHKIRSSKDDSYIHLSSRAKSEFDGDHRNDES